MAITDILIVILCILAFRQLTRQRLVIAIACALPCGAFAIYSHQLPNIEYYKVAALISSLLLVGICFFAKHSRFANCMAAICFCGVILNAIGLELYSRGNDGFWYERGFELLYALVICLYLTKGKANVTIWKGLFRLPYFSGDLGNSILHKKAQT